MSLNQIWTDINYVYSATTSGLVVIDVDTELQVNCVPYAGGFNSVWADEDKVYLATSNSGIRCVSTALSASASSTIPFVDFPLITGSEVTYLHGNHDKLMCCTVSGVNIIRLDSVGTITSSTISGVSKCFVTNNSFYYTVYDSVDWFIYRIDSSDFDWTTPDYSWSTDDVFSSGITINDLYVTEETADDGVQNTLFVATSEGIYVLDESLTTYDVYLTIES